MGTIKQQKSYWDVAITYEFRIDTSSPPSRAEWNFTSNETGASMYSVLEMAFSKFYVFRYDWLRAGYELRFINLNVKLIEG